MVAGQRSPSAPLAAGAAAPRSGAAAHPRAGSRATPVALVRRYLSCLRYREILVLQGSPLIGAVFSMGKLRADRLGALLVFAAASVMLVAHVFALNDWAGVDADLEDANKVAGVFATKGISRGAMRRLWIVLLVLSLALFGLLGARPLAIALAIAILGLLYSRPASPAKSLPVLGSLLHLGGGMLHFLLGCSLFRAIDAPAVTLSFFFGLAFAAGHLHQEVRDFDGDVRNAIKTNAVTFGKLPTFIAGLALFTLAYAQLVLVAAWGILPVWLAGLALLYPVHLYWSFQAAAAGLTFASIGQLQARYRALFAVIGAAMLALLLIWPSPR